MAIFFGTEDADEITQYEDISDGVTSTPPGLLRPTALADLIHGYGGADSLGGGGGYDTIYGGDGDDLIYETGNLGPQDDGVGGQFFGEAGNDRIYMTRADDLNPSYLDGGLGNDTVLGHGTVLGGNGNDRVSGSGLLLGGAGNDRFDGFDEGDLIRGGSGADTLRGVGGSDTLIGGAGDDTFYYYFMDGDQEASPPEATDLIRAAGTDIPAFEGAGAAEGDVIVMSGFDSDGDGWAEPMIFGGGRGLGHIWIAENGTRTLIYANFDDDAAPEFKLAISDGDVRASEYTADDFIL